MAKVLKRLPYAANGYTIEILNEGDERDFGAATQGLVAEGYIEDESAPVVVASTAKKK